jgi:predicted nucleic acid-binding Zn ribbon protein
MMKDVCLECGSQILGRLDKKFCTDQCRYMYNNKRKRLHEVAIQNVNRILRKNRSILKSLNPVGKTTVRRSLLENKDFDFNFHTHIYRTKSGAVYYFIYEYGYALEADEKIVLVTYQKYMDQTIHNLFKNVNE